MSHSNHQDLNSSASAISQTTTSTKKKRLIEKVCSDDEIYELIPESATYHDLFAFERKLDSTINRLTLDIQDALKKPPSTRTKKTLRIFISNLFYTHQDTGAPSWELKIEGRLTEDLSSRTQKRKFSTFFNRLVIELDDAIYGPTDHLIEWKRTPNITETDGFQLRRPGDLPVKCIILFQLEHQPRYYKLDKRLARLLKKQTNTRPAIITAIWQYIKNKSLQDSMEREYINNDKYLEKIFDCKRMKYTEIPSKLNNLLSPLDPIVIHHQIIRGIGETQRSIYEIDVEIEEPTSHQSNQKDSLVIPNTCIQESQQLEEKICDTLEAIKMTRNTFDLFTSFAENPYQFTDKWLATQSSDLKLPPPATNTQQQPQHQQPQQHQQQPLNTTPDQNSTTRATDNSEEERRADYYYQPWLQEAVCRYFYRKIQERRGDLKFS